MQSTRGKSRDSSDLAFCLEGTSPDPAALAGIRPIRNVAPESHRKTKPHRILILFIVGLLLLLGLAPLRSALAQNPFDISGAEPTGPDSCAQQFGDEQGALGRVQDL